MTTRTVQSVRVVIHVSEDGGLAVGILTSEHHGARRLDRRYRSARPTDHRLASTPRGVPAVLWAASQALARLCDEMEQEARSTDR